MPGRDGWVSASELADYAYCPRSHWYSLHPPATGRAPDAQRRSNDGRRYHRTELAGESRRERHGLAYAAALVVGLIAVAGGVAWIFLR